MSKAINGLKYDLLPNNEAIIVGYDKNNLKERIVIPETISANGTTYLVTRIAEGALHNNSTLKCIAIPDTIQRIDCHVFSYCENLANIINYSNSETSIEYNTFENIGVHEEIIDDFVRDVIVDGATTVDEHGVAYIDLEGRFSYYYNKPESHEQFDLNWE